MTESNEQIPQEPDGVRWLKMLGREDLIGSTFTLKDGTIMAAENFPEACPEDAANMLFALEQLGPEHPLYVKNAPIAQHAIEVYLGAPTKDQV